MQNRLTVFDNLRIPLSLGVFLSHAAAGLNLLEVNYSIFDSLSVVVFKLLSILLPLLVIPGFFFISGYFFFYKWTNGEDGKKVWNNACYIGKLKTRFFTLFIPYIIWNVIPLIVLIFECIWQYGGTSDFIPQLRIVFQGKFPAMFWDLNKWENSSGPLNLPLYYLRDLMPMCLLSPLVFWYVRHLKHFGIVLLLLLYIGCMIPSTPGLRNTAIMFFTLGAYFSIWKYDILSFLSRYSILIVLSTFIIIPIVCGFIDIPWGIGYSKTLFSLLGLGTLLLLSKCDVLFANVRSFYSESIFFAYAAHEGLPVLLSSLSVSVWLIPGFTNTAILLQYLLAIFMTITICLFLYCILKRVCPLVCSILNGCYVPKR